MRLCLPLALAALPGRVLVAVSQDQAAAQHTLLDIFVPSPSSIQLLPPVATTSPSDSTLVLSTSLDIVVDFADVSGRVEWLVSHFQRRYNAAAGHKRPQVESNVHSLRLCCLRGGDACAGDASPPQLGMDESYSLTVQPRQAAVLEASNRAGLARGLETFLQFAQAQAVQQVPRGFLIEDRPRTKWRGLLVDVSRHFMPIALLRRTLFEMAAFKLNTLHLHLTDAVSFPIRLESHPELAEQGAFSADKTYSPDEMMELVQLAGNLSIRVVPEVDVPAHTASWRHGAPAAVANCDWLVPLDRSQADNPFKKLDLVALDPSRPETLALVKEILNEVLGIFPDKFVHVGGDEIDFRCWTTHPQVKQWLANSSLTPTAALRQFYEDTVFHILEQHGRRPVVWEDALDSLGQQLPMSAVVQPWKAWGQPMIGSLAAARASALGHEVVQSTGAYLDWDYSTNEMIEGLKELERDGLGGEAALWTERIDFTNAQCRLWPRLLAVADVLWASVPLSAERAGAYARRHAAVSWQARQQWQRGVALLPLTDVELCDAPTTGIEAEVARIMADTSAACPLLDNQAIQRDAGDWAAHGF